jgi:hypothetical protein
MRTRRQAAEGSSEKPAKTIKASIKAKEPREIEEKIPKQRQPRRQVQDDAPEAKRTETTSAKTVKKRKSDDSSAGRGVRAPAKGSKASREAQADVQPSATEKPSRKAASTSSDTALEQPRKRRRGKAGAKVQDEEQQPPSDAGEAAGMAIAQEAAADMQQDEAETGPRIKGRKGEGGSKKQQPSTGAGEAAATQEEAAADLQAGEAEAGPKLQKGGALDGQLAASDVPEAPDAAGTRGGGGDEDGDDDDDDAPEEVGCQHMSVAPGITAFHVDGARIRTKQHACTCRGMS